MPFRTIKSVYNRFSALISAPAGRQRHPWQAISLMTIIMMAASNCSMELRQAPEWSYRQPPTPGAPAIVPEGGVWCDTAGKAIFMATTGFFTKGCSSSRLIPGSYQVILVEHIAQNDVRSWVVKIGDARDRFLWIPLPDHNWA